MMMEEQEVSTTNQPIQAALGLSFSGGGYRAAAYGLGSLALLQDLGLLSRAKVLSGVSGGSVAIGAYLCSKAGSEVQQEEEFAFYDRFYTPFLAYLNTEKLATAFVSLPKLLAGKKLLHAAADDLDSFLAKQLGGGQKRGNDPALFGNKKIADMLKKPGLAPDYVFFNTSNITTLDLFRFGLQRTRNNDTPTYVLNRYFLKPIGHEASAEIHRHAGQIRLADCVASSFAFPIGFEPMIFPHDFFRADNRIEQQQERLEHHNSNQPDSTQGKNHTYQPPWEAAKTAFEMTPICDHKPYVAFLDGGLYDNLGLASIEDIRTMINTARSNNRNAAGQSVHPETPIRYVIATDVDNIQPSNSSYQDPDLDGKPASACGGAEGRRQRCRRRPLQRWRRWLVSTYKWLLLVGPIVILYVWTIQRLMSVALGGTALAIVMFSVLGALLTAGGLLVLAWCWLRGRVTTWKRGLGAKQNSPAGPGPSLGQILGLGADFKGWDQAIDPISSLVGVVVNLLFKPDPARRVAELRSALVYRRVKQLVPAFSGYLKRTRSLTYGYLEQVYAQALVAQGDRNHPGSDSEPAATSGAEDRCALIRNMIFELSPGPDVDPERDAYLITLPTRDYALREDQNDRGPNWVVSRKLRRATNLATWLRPKNSTTQPISDNKPRGKHTQKVKALVDKIEVNDARLQTEFAFLPELNINSVADIWLWLTEELGFDHSQEARANAKPTSRCDTKHPMCNHEIDKLVRDVRLALHEAMASAAEEQRGLEQLLRDRGKLLIDETSNTSSWIPLICEMATNLPTTLWTSGFRWYVFSAPERDGDRQPGGWYSYQPGPDKLMDRQWLDFGANTHMANQVTVLAGYLGMAFNLLEFTYTTFSAATTTHATSAMKQSMD